MSTHISDALPVTDPSELVDHFFRHEYGRLVSLLTGWLGVRHLELVEDVVQMALWKALQQWSRHGVPAEPAAWLYRTARNLATDHLRRESNFQRIADQLGTTSSDRHHSSPASTAAIDVAVDAGIGDEPLRLLFLCCHPSIALQSQIALALKVVGGFSVREIANGLLASPDNIEKRLTRAKQSLREVGQELTDLKREALNSRIDAVLQVLYLMFNEGFSASTGDLLIKQELCDEAIRLTDMLHASHIAEQQPTVAALLALMLMHSARFSTRVDADQCVVLLADQDRQQWDWAKIRLAMHHMLHAANGEQLSRYHIEAAIAWEHCRAHSFAQTDWPRVVQLYEMLWHIAPSPMVKLNQIIASSYADDCEHSLRALLALDAATRRQLRPWWDCAMAELLQRSGQLPRALSHLRDALKLAGCTASRTLIANKIAATESRG